ncbi:MAG: exosortase W [Nitrospirae bacterium]|nr:exosortase W [Nitrospirota bacterium]MCL5237693.1 exosortase W [Nitrospirota bacterium]
MNNNTKNQALPCASLLPVKIWPKAALLASVLIFAYFDTLSFIVRIWLHRDGYSHGFLVPFISLYFIYADRNRLKQIPVLPNIPGGMALLLGGCLMLLLGDIGSVSMIQQISLIVTLSGLVVILSGMRYLKALSLPLAYLVLMIPALLDPVMDRLHWPFQLFAAAVSAELLRLVNIPVFRHAQYLELPGTILEVANACSGVRYLLSIIALGVPLAYFTQRTWMRRAGLVILAVIIGILANPVRIALIGMWTYYTGQDVHGPLHIFQGFFVSVIGFVFLIAGAWFLAGIPARQGPKAGSMENTAGGGLITANPARLNKVWFIATGILLIAGVFLNLYSPEPVPLKSPLSTLPRVIGDWECDDSVSGPAPFRAQVADYNLDRTYRNGSGREIRLHIGYFEFQRRDKKLAHYSLQRLYGKAEEIAITANAATPARINKTILEERGRNSLFLYWHDLGGRITANRYKEKLITIINGLIHRRTNGATVIISCGLESPDTAQRTLHDAIEFAQLLLPVLRNYLP